MGKYVIDQINKTLILDTTITYRNLEQILCGMYDLYAERMGGNVSRVSSVPTSSAEIEDGAKIMNLF